MQNYNLQRFIEAQAPVYDNVVQELKIGTKQSHWMWFIFPQIKGLGMSSMSQFYGITGIDEAVAYLMHPILGQRLIDCCQILLAYQGKSAEQIFGGIDSMKLKSSMTLFQKAFSDAATQVNSNKQENVFDKVLDQYFQGEHDAKTLSLLENRY